MVIVIIHWKILLGDEPRRQFLQYWKETLTVEERSHLVGEYLSAPLSAEEVQFPCAVFNIPSAPPYQSFFNVGIWEDVDSFKRQIIDPYVGMTPNPQPFEYQFRERMVLSPLSWRAGQYSLPAADHFV
jgi:hypothetical protein